MPASITMALVAVRPKVAGRSRLMPASGLAAAQQYHTGTRGQDSARIWRRARQGLGPQGDGMDKLTIGDAILSRIEETADTSFTAEGFFPAFDPELMRPHMSWMARRYYLRERGALVFSMHAPHGGHVRANGAGFALQWLGARS